MYAHGAAARAQRLKRAYAAATPRRPSRRLSTGPCGLLDESCDSDFRWQHICAQSIRRNVSALHVVKVAAKRKSKKHFLSTCPKFHHARTAAHNQVCKVLTARFISIWQLTCLFTVKLRSVRQGSSQNWSPLQSCCSQRGEPRIRTLQHHKCVLEDGNLIFDQLIRNLPVAMTRTLPVATCLHTINLINTPLSALNLVKVAAKRKAFEFSQSLS